MLPSPDVMSIPKLDEQVVLESEGGFVKLQLTTHRVICRQKSRPRSLFASILLSDVTYCAAFWERRTRWLWGGSLAFISAGLLSAVSLGKIAVILAVVGLICFVAYLYTRRAVLVVASSGGRIEVPLSQVPMEEVERFVALLHAMKLRRPGEMQPQAGSESSRARPDA